MLLRDPNHLNQQLAIDAAATHATNELSLGIAGDCGQRLASFVYIAVIIGSELVDKLILQVLINLLKRSICIPISLSCWLFWIQS